MSPVTGLARLPGRIFTVCSYEKFQHGRRGCNQRNTTYMLEHKVLSFAAVVGLWTLQILLIKLIRILLKWKCKTLCYFRRYVAKAKLFCLRNFRSSNPSWSVYTGKFSSLFPRDLGLGFWYEHIEIFTNGRVARRDLGNRASPVDREEALKSVLSVWVVKSADLWLRLWVKLDLQIKVTNISYRVLLKEKSSSDGNVYFESGNN